VSAKNADGAVQRCLELEAVNHGREAWARLKKDQTFENEDWLLAGRRSASAVAGRCG
jgi:hypothetical protein